VYGLTGRQAAVAVATGDLWPTRIQTTRTTFYRIQDLSICPAASTTANAPHPQLRAKLTDFAYAEIDPSALRRSSIFSAGGSPRVGAATCRASG